MALISPGSPSDSVDVSVVIVNYNVREYLQQCLESIRKACSRLRVEVIVVDNNSHDNSTSMLADKYPEVHSVALEENIGFGRANNVGIELSRGRYTLLLNPDTIIREDTLDQMFDYMQAHPETGISGCKVLNADGSFQMQCRRGFPSPWASFCKLFGLQRLFPKSPLFARYNQTFRSEDETYHVDAVIGAFMFCRTDALRRIGGFDPEFFMYGEDLDLCFRMGQAGFTTDYVPISTIIHFKGESTRRSSINELRVFYDAMEIFARKHYGSSSLFLLFLRCGIYLRSFIAYLKRHRLSLIVIIFDLLSVIAMFMCAVKLRRGDYFALPAYAFPTVFIVIPLVVFFSMVMVGEYFEYKPTARRAAVGLLMSFFILSSLTYYWNEYAFSRGVLLMTVGLSFGAILVIRSALALHDKFLGDDAERRMLLVGSAQSTHEVRERLRKENALRINVVGWVALDTDSQDAIVANDALGHVDYLPKLITQHNVDEVIFLSSDTSSARFIAAMQSAAGLGVRFHRASDADSVIALGIADRIRSKSSTDNVFRILSFRARLLKRGTDILVSAIVLLIFSPVVILTAGRTRLSWRPWWEVLRAKKTLVGLYPPAAELANVVRIGITGLAHVANASQLSAETIHELNEYYVRNYSPALDVDIILKSLFSSR